MSGVLGGAHEERLIDEIFEQRRYVKYARPVLHETDALNVEFGISLQQIIDVVSPSTTNSLSHRRIIVPPGPDA